MKAVILAGGLGTRLREETEYRPKPMVEIGGMPIIWHIMKQLSTQGINDFVIALGYKGTVIKDYFLNYKSRSRDFTINLGTHHISTHGVGGDETWNVTLVDTGPETMTGGRIKKLSQYLNGENNFLVTYGDGLSNIDLTQLTKFHESHGQMATVTAAQPISRFGKLEVNDSGQVVSFQEKMGDEGWVNAGYFIFNSSFLEILEDDVPLESKPLEYLVSKNQLFAYKHTGFWQPMDTIREAELLNKMWLEGKSPWKTWE
jgi:glucose-1-phosphate cytidylyltransferase